MPVMTIAVTVQSIILLVIGAPFAVALGLSTVTTIIVYRPVPTLQIIPQLFCESATTFILLAVPIFILAGTLMEKGTLGRNLIDFTTSIVNWMSGGLGSANVVGSMIFGGISGSSLADTATFGKILVPRMVDDGYPKDYAAAVTLTSSSLSVVIPPSILIVMAAAATNQSVSRALAGGLLPGVLITTSLLVPNIIISTRRGYGHRIPFSLKNVWGKTLTCWTSLVAPFIILGAIFTGIVTPTEAAGIAVLYILIVDFVIFKKLTVNDIIESLKQSAVLTSTILFIATSSALTNFIVAYENIPQKLTEVLLDMPGGKIGFLIIIDILLVIMGMMLDASPAILVFTPLLLPIAQNMGVNPGHFIVLSVAGLALGLTTPPYGVCLFSIASVCKIPVDRLVKQAIPFYVAMIIALVLITFVPALSLALPDLFGL